MAVTQLSCPACGGALGEKESGKCPYCGQRYSISQPLTAHARSPGRAHRGSPAAPPTPMGIGTRIVLGIFGSGLSIVGLILPVSFWWETRGSRFGDEAIGSGVLLGLGALLLAGAGLTPLAVCATFVGGAMLLSKPVLRPMTSEWDGQVHAFGLTSETHLNFLVPGALAWTLALILAASFVNKLLRRRAQRT